jgi:heme exporter protein A
MELILDTLSCRRAGRTVFRDLSLRLPGGRACVVRGPNGVGKSTLLRVLAGFLPPEGGDVRIEGAEGTVSLGSSRGAFQERVAYAGHLDAVKPALGVAENLAVWAAMNGTAPERVGAALERFGLGAIAARPAAQCSAGQKRRLGLARLLVTDRPVWLMDEPTVSLDAASSRLVAELVREHLATGGVALIATHIDLGLANPVELRMEPVREAVGASADPFLDGAWA